MAARVPVPRIIGGTLLGILLGFLLPYITVLQLTLLPLWLIPVLLLGGVFMAWLHGWCGWVPTAAFMTTLIFSALSVDIGAMWIVIACMVLPGISDIVFMTRKTPFFRQLSAALIVHLLGLLCAIFVAYSRFGADMIAKLMASIQAQYAQMPDYVIAEIIAYFNQSMGGMGTGASGGTMTVEAFRSALEGAVILMQQVYSENIPGSLLSGAVWSAVLAVLWGNWRMAKRGIATSESYVGISQWFLPPQVTVGALVLLLAGLVMTMSERGSGSTAWNACTSLASAAFTIQALASIDRRFKRRGVSTAGRKTRVGLLLALFWVLPLLLGQGYGALPQLYGAASALFGSRGAVTLLRKKIEDHSDDDDHGF